MAQPLRVAVVGASGYTGLELLRILLRHPRVRLAAVTSEQRAGRSLGECFPSLAGLTELCFTAVDPAALARAADFAFTALPHATSAHVVAKLRKAGLAVADLSADFRLRASAVYEQWYGPHAAPELLGAAVYGLPELHRAALRCADFVAVPGCYPTGALLPIAPFLREGWVSSAPLFIDAKSGVSGAGRTLAEDYLFAELADSCHAYKVGGVHRHVPEIAQEVERLAGAQARVSFVPHLLPIARGIATTVFAQPTREFTDNAARDLLQETYRDEFFVRVLPQGATPRIRSVRGSNFCDVAVVRDAGTGVLILLSALDNLVKGAAGQAVQCMNLMRGFPETEGLLEAPLVP